jgi:hypothetical protein
MGVAVDQTGAGGAGGVPETDIGPNGHEPAVARMLDWRCAELDMLEAPAFRGVYEICEFPKGCIVTWRYGTCARRLSDKVGVSLDQAKELAQKDFELVVTDCVLPVADQQGAVDRSS